MNKKNKANENKTVLTLYRCLFPIKIVLILYDQCNTTMNKHMKSLYRPFYWEEGAQIVTSDVTLHMSVLITQ